MQVPRSGGEAGQEGQLAGVAGRLPRGLCCCLRHWQWLCYHLWQPDRDGPLQRVPKAGLELSIGLGHLQLYQRWVFYLGWVCFTCILYLLLAWMDQLKLYQRWFFILGWVSLICTNRKCVSSCAGSVSARWVFCLSWISLSSTKSEPSLWAGTSSSLPKVSHLYEPGHLLLYQRWAISLSRDIFFSSKGEPSLWAGTSSSLAKVSHLYEPGHLLL